jgi:hypothetical protein
VADTVLLVDFENVGKIDLAAIPAGVRGSPSRRKILHGRLSQDDASTSVRLQAIQRSFSSCAAREVGRP